MPLFTSTFEQWHGGSEVRLSKVARLQRDIGQQQIKV